MIDVDTESRHGVVPALGARCVVRKLIASLRKVKRIITETSEASKNQPVGPSGARPESARRPNDNLQVSAKID
jgi:hypothetical protein